MCIRINLRRFIFQNNNIMILKFLFDRVVAFMKQTKRETIADLSKCLLLSLLSELNNYFIFKRLYEYVYIVLYIVYTSRIRTFDTYQYYKANN